MSPLRGRYRRPGIGPSGRTIAVESLGQLIRGLRQAAEENARERREMLDWQDRIKRRQLLEESFEWQKEQAKVKLAERKQAAVEAKEERTEAREMRKESREWQREQAREAAEARKERHRLDEMRTKAAVDASKAQREVAQYQLNAKQARTPEERAEAERQAEEARGKLLDAQTRGMALDVTLKEAEAREKGLLPPAPLAPGAAAPTGIFAMSRRQAEELFITQQRAQGKDVGMASQEAATLPMHLLQSAIQRGKAVGKKEIPAFGKAWRKQMLKEIIPSTLGFETMPMFGGKRLSAEEMRKAREREREIALENRGIESPLIGFRRTGKWLGERVGITHKKELTPWPPPVVPRVAERGMTAEEAEAYEEAKRQGYVFSKENIARLLSEPGPTL